MQDEFFTKYHSLLTDLVKNKRSGGDDRRWRFYVTEWSGSSEDTEFVLGGNLKEFMIFQVAYFPSPGKGVSQNYLRIISSLRKPPGFYSLRWWYLENFDGLGRTDLCSQMKVFGSRNQSRLGYLKPLLKYVVPRKLGETLVCCVGLVLFKACRLGPIGRLYDSLGRK